MKTLALLLALSLGGCSLIEKVPPLEVCLVYKGKKLCAVKRGGEWFLSVDLTAEERAEVIEGLEKAD